MTHLSSKLNSSLLFLPTDSLSSHGWSSFIWCKRVSPKLHRQISNSGFRRIALKVVPSFVLSQINEENPVQDGLQRAGINAELNKSPTLDYNGQGSNVG